jgi:SpoVK/Ycf46/Vps4 family AAA+-type ATPase
MKFEIPFDLLVIFATNIEPKDLVDEAFLRRMPHKIRVNHPGLEQYREIFQKVCEVNGIPFREDVFEYLIQHCYQRMNVSFNACHPRDLMLQVIDSARYHGKRPEMTIENLTQAWESYFVDL